MQLTFNSKLSDALRSIWHLTKVNPIVVRSNIVDGESAPGSFLFHPILTAGHQPLVLQVPGSWDRLIRNFTLQHSDVPLLYLHVLQWPSEPDRRP